MKALVFDGRFHLSEVAQPYRQKGEALIRVRMAGICNTDIEIVRGYMNFRGILGHEFVGEVIGSEGDQLVGRRVVGEINLACGDCDFCRSGLSRHCPNRRVLGIYQKDGVFAEYLTLPLENLHPVSEGLPDEEAVFVEPLAAALEILEQGPPHPSDKVAIIGDGKLGLLVAQVLQSTGAQITLVGKHPQKMQLATRWGLDTCPASKAKSLPPQDVVVECSGSPSGWELALQLIRPQGTLILKSTYHQSFPFNPAPLVIHEIRLVGSRCGPFPAAIRLLEEGKIQVKPLIHRIFSLSQALEAFEYAQQEGVLKVLLRMD